jgi:hypothetical protein
MIDIKKKKPAVSWGYTREKLIGGKWETTEWKQVEGPPSIFGEILKMKVQKQ